MRAGFELFLIQFVNYLIITLNYRAIATLNYPITFLTDIGCATLTFLSIKRVAHASSRLEQILYTLGGACGALLALWLSAHVPWLSPK